MSNPYKEILCALADAHVDFIVGGGVACVLHGVERVTMDVDLAVQMVPANLDRFLNVMSALALRPRVPVPPQVLKDPDAVQMMIEEKHALVFTFLDPDRPIRQVDMFLRSNHAFEILDTDADTVDIDGRKIRVVGKRRLLDIKRAIQPPRTKDQIDIDVLTNLLEHEPN